MIISDLIVYILLFAVADVADGQKEKGTLSNTAWLEKTAKEVYGDTSVDIAKLAGGTAWKAGRFVIGTTYGLGKAALGVAWENRDTIGGLLKSAGGVGLDAGKFVAGTTCGLGKGFLGKVWENQAAIVELLKSAGGAALDAGKFVVSGKVKKEAIELLGSAKKWMMYDAIVGYVTNGSIVVPLSLDETTKKVEVIDSQRVFPLGRINDKATLVPVKELKDADIKMIQVTRNEDGTYKSNQKKFKAKEVMADRKFGMMVNVNVDEKSNTPFVIFQIEGESAPYDKLVAYRYESLVDKVPILIQEKMGDSDKLTRIKEASVKQEPDLGRSSGNSPENDSDFQPKVSGKKGIKSHPKLTGKKDIKSHPKTPSKQDIKPQPPPRSKPKSKPEPALTSEKKVRFESVYNVERSVEIISKRRVFPLGKIGNEVVLLPSASLGTLNIPTKSVSILGGKMCEKGSQKKFGPKEIFQEPMYGMRIAVHSLSGKALYVILQLQDQGKPPGEAKAYELSAFLQKIRPVRLVSVKGKEKLKVIDQAVVDVPPKRSSQKLQARKEQSKNVKPKNK